MKYCIKCNKYNCCCTPYVKTIINSEQAGREGLSAYEISVLTGKYSGSENDFPDWIKGEKGDTYIPELTDNYFND